MGKDSLIKSTADKKTKTKAKTQKATSAKKPIQATKKAKSKTRPKQAAPTKTKKTAAKKKAAKKTPATKVAPKKKSTATKTKSSARPKSKTTIKAKTKVTAKSKKKSVSTKRDTKITAKELLFKSFDPISKIAKPAASRAPNKETPSAPPWVNPSDPKRAARIRELLLQSHSLLGQPATEKPQETGQPAVAEQAGQPATPHRTIAKKITAVPQPPSEEAATGFKDASSQQDADPVSKAAKMLVVGIGIVVLLILMTSYSNSSKYFIQPKDNAIEIWKGRFSPKDNRFFMVLHGTQYSGKIKAVYTRDEVYPLVFNYYLEKADTLLEVPGLPDFDGIKIYLNDARKFAINKNMRKTISLRINSIERMILLYKADVAISKGTVKSIDAAIKHLTSAQKLIANPAQGQEIQQKLNLATSLKAALEAKGSKKGI